MSKQRKVSDIWTLATIDRTMTQLEWQNWDNSLANQISDTTQTQPKVERPQFVLSSLEIDTHTLHLYQPVFMCSHNCQPFPIDLWVDSETSCIQSVNMTEGHGLKEPDSPHSEAELGGVSVWMGDLLRTHGKPPWAPPWKQGGMYL